MKTLMSTIGFLAALGVANIGVASDASVESARKAHNEKMMKDWEKDKDKNKDAYKETKAYKKLNPEDQKKFDKDWEERKAQLERSKKKKQ